MTLLQPPVQTHRPSARPTHTHFSQQHTFPSLQSTQRARGSTRLKAWASVVPLLLKSAVLGFTKNQNVPAIQTHEAGRTVQQVEVGVGLGCSMILCSPKTGVKWSHPASGGIELFVRGHVSGWAEACGTILHL